jgi:hypothetical protein
MRNLHDLDRHRVMRGALIEQRFGGYTGDGTCGAFLLHSPTDGGLLRIIAASDGHWEHVSVSRRDRCPTWAEMEHVKRQFFNDDETAIELHVPPSEHINVHAHCLHMWRPCDGSIPLPPSIYV